ncbi:MAG: hypothetical protein ACP5QT_00300 [Brevinematia bacterium]
MRKKLLFVLLFISELSFSEVDLCIYNSSYVYNGENGSYWEETRYTLTYLENLFQPYLAIKQSENLIFKIGVGILLPFNQEEKIKNFYPYFQTKITNEGLELNVGSLDNTHDFPPPILDPLVGLTPSVRVLTESQIPIDYESFPTGIFSHGFYEYGVQLKYNRENYNFETYINWQLPDTPNHRERFDVGLIGKIHWFYISLHYWHNGGHENPHPVEITENYVGATGFKDRYFTALYLASYFLPDRDAHPEKNIFGQGIYLAGSIEFYGFNIEPELFISSSFINRSEKFISIEGDPFYRVPLYIGLNIIRIFKLNEICDLEIGFINGGFLPYTDIEWNPLMIRYDQKLRVSFDYKLSL